MQQCYPPPPPLLLPRFLFPCTLYRLQTELIQCPHNPTHPIPPSIMHHRTFIHRGHTYLHQQRLLFLRIHALPPVQTILHTPPPISLCMKKSDLCILTSMATALYHTRISLNTLGVHSPQSQRAQSGVLMPLHTMRVCPCSTHRRLQ